MNGDAECATLAAADPPRRAVASRLDRARIDGVLWPCHVGHAPRVEFDHAARPLCNEQLARPGEGDVPRHVEVLHEHFDGDIGVRTRRRYVPSWLPVGCRMLVPVGGRPRRRPWRGTPATACGYRCPRHREKRTARQ